jgi:pimeloyl-ACP methyl ester carboxylesterase
LGERYEQVATSGGGRVEYLVTGSGEPGTVFGHGLAGSLDETRPLGSGVAGRRAFLHFRGHGRSVAGDDRWDYAGLADDLLAVADGLGATRALGVSMGAGAVLATLAADPYRFDRVVLVAPATFDRPIQRGGRFERMADLVDAGDVVGLAALLLDDVPPAARASEQGRRYAEQRAARLIGTGVSRALRSIPGRPAVTDRAALARVRCPVLVVGHEDDPTHPAEVAREVAAALPGAVAHVYDEPGPMWHAPRHLRRLISGFLDE